MRQEKWLKMARMWNKQENQTFWAVCHTSSRNILYGPQNQDAMNLIKDKNTKIISSKHCETCGRCVYGFDHHWRWLNNCIGQPNYWYFFTLAVIFNITNIYICGVTLTVIIMFLIDKNDDVLDEGKSNNYLFKYFFL